MEPEDALSHLDNDPSETVQWLHSIDYLLGAKWLHRSPPRIPVGTIIEDKYKVSRCLIDARKYQLLGADTLSTKETECPYKSYVLKVIRPSQIGKRLTKNQLECMRTYSRNVSEGWSGLLDDFGTKDMHVMVFIKYKFTLRSLLDDDTLSPLSSQHVQEIALQVVKATRFIHKRFSLHGDICPETIEFFNSERTSYSVYNHTIMEFETRHVLACTKLQVAYYGDFGIRSVCTGTDQYRAPEVVFGHRYSNTADLFSIGCVIAELALGEPLFPACVEGSSLYRLEKALLFHTISGPFSEELAAKIELNYPCTMDMTEIRPILYSGISETVAKMVHRPIFLEWMFSQNDTEIAEVVGGLVKTNHRLRSNLDTVLDYDFFHKRYN